MTRLQAHDHRVRGLRVGIDDCRKSVRGWIITGAFLAAVLPWCLGADDPESRYFQQLRDRHLFVLAEGYCLGELAGDRLSPDPSNEITAVQARRSRQRRTLLTLELARTFLEHSRYTSADEQSELIERAEDILDQAIDDDPANPRIVLLKTQRALIPVVRAEDLRWRVELEPHNSQIRSSAVAAAEDAIARLAKLERLIRDSVKSDGRRDDDEPRPWELQRLLDEVRFRLGGTHLNRALVSPPNSEGRITSAIDAEDYVKRFAGHDDHQYSVISRVMIARCRRLRGDSYRAGILLDELEAESSPEIQQHVVPERMRYLLDDGRPDDAVQAAIAFRQQHGRLSGELHVLKLQALFALRSMTNDVGDVEATRKLDLQIETNAQHAGLEAGGYWNQRCQLILQRARDTVRLGSRSAELLQQAKAAWAAGRLDAAVAGYQQAATSALQNHQSEVAVDLATTAASMLLKAGRFRDSHRAFQSIVDDYPECDRTPEAHLLAAWCLGQIFQQQRTRQRREAYMGALREHRSRWRDHPTADDAIWMLARLQEARSQFTQALQLYATISAAHQHGQQARVGVARMCERILDRLEQTASTDRDVKFWQQRIRDRLTQAVQGITVTSRAAGPEQVELAVRSARSLVRLNTPDYDLADRLVEYALNPDVDSPADDDALMTWRQTASRLRIVTLAGRGRLDEASNLMRLASASGASSLLALLDGLSRLAGSANPELSQKLAQLQLKTAEQLREHRNELSPADQSVLNRSLVQACIASGQMERAARLYESLAGTGTLDSQTITRLAAGLEATTEPRLVAQAKRLWSGIEAGEEAGSQSWFAARLHVAHCCVLQEQYEEAVRLIQVTTLLYPDLGGASLKSEFEKLQEEIGRRTSGSGGEN